MSKQRTDAGPLLADEALPVQGLEPLAQGYPGDTGTVKSVGPARVFRDKVFTSRTLILPDGSTVPVVAGRVTACGDGQYEFLKAHPDLEQLPE